MKAVSLSGELIVLERSVQAAILLLEADGSAEPDVPTCRAALATLALLASRLELLRRAVAGAVDPALLWSDHNAAHAKAPGDDPDIVLRARERRT